MRQTVTRSAPLNYVSVLPEGDAGDTPLPLIVGLHGFGAGMEDLAGLTSGLFAEGVRYAFPEAPRLAFDASEPTARAWYERGGAETLESVAEALTALDGCVQELMRRFPVGERGLALVGFSQGGAMALRYGLPRPELVRGIAVLSGSARRLDELQPQLPTRRTQPIFVAHGWRDDMVPFEVGKRAVEVLERWGYRPVWKQYPIGHWISPPLLADLRAWMRGVLS